jgi:hypothetical protein
LEAESVFCRAFLPGLGGLSDAWMRQKKTHYWELPDFRGFVTGVLEDFAEFFPGVLQSIGFQCVDWRAS